MKYIILIICALALPVAAFAAHTLDEQKEGRQTSTLQKAPDKPKPKSEGSCILDPHKALHMMPFN